MSDERLRVGRLRQDLSRVDLQHRWIVALTAAALVIRVTALGGEAIRPDEAITMQLLELYSPFELIYEIPGRQPHPPLYYVLLDLWTAVFGTGVVAIRIPSVIFGVATIPVVYTLVDHLSDERAAVLATALVVVSPYFVAISQLARMYALFVFLISLSYLLLLWLTESVTRRRVTAYAGVVTLLALTHFYALFVVFGHMIVIAIHGDLRFRDLLSTRLVRVPVAALLTVMSTLVVVKFLGTTGMIAERQPFGLSTARQALPPHGISPMRVFLQTFDGSGWNPSWLVYNDGAREFLTDPIGPRPISDAIVRVANVGSPALLYLVAAILGGWILYVRRGFESTGAYYAVVVWFLVPFVGIIDLGLLGIQFNPRYSAVAVIPFFALVGVALAQIRNRSVRVVTVAVVVTLLLAQTAVYAGDTYRRDHGDVRRYLDDRVAPDDDVLVAYHTFDSHFSFQPEGYYYDPAPFDVTPFELRNHPEDSLRNATAGDDRVWFVSPLRWQGFTDDVNRSMRNISYHQSDVVAFDTVLVVQFTANESATGSLQSRRPRPDRARDRRPDVLDQRRYTAEAVRVDATETAGPLARLLD
ncbi:hypothetical protein BRD17_00045 [Halobacteriales archaeon SW_7_68_16]|nr:MAG: hypothetical protein BRD17_00045 [Halobacteriales archaeon SW_7_68_16]